MIKVSVITICYNEAANIASTLESVGEQSYSCIEHIVKDGGSTDGTIEIVKQYAKSHPALRFESSRDGGLYNGMNIGLSRATGEYVIFCNAGDRFLANDVIERMVSKVEAENIPDLVYGDSASEENGDLIVRGAHGPGFMSIGMPAAHEAMLYKLSLVRKLKLEYDVSYRIAADYKFTYQFVNAATTFAYANIPVVIFSDGGVSTANKWRGLMESCRVRKEIGKHGYVTRLTIAAMQICVLCFSTYLGPLYRFFRLKKIKTCGSD